MTENNAKQIRIENIVTDILGTIDREREREIISRRFGLFDRKETLEQIGELLGITRERVRQLEKAIVARLKAQADEGQLPHIKEIESTLLDRLYFLGNVTRVSTLSSQFNKDNSRIDQARMSFLATLCPKIIVIDENDHFYHAVAVGKEYDEKKVKSLVTKIIEAIKQIGEPVTLEKLVEATKLNDSKQVSGLAGISKHLATLNDKWGLVKWPTVNPKNIRDKIYVVLQEAGKYMHFSEIAEAIKKSDFKRKDVTTQAIHNELIKDKRFVLIGRGIYALKEWGYKKGTVADIISDVLKKADEPLHRDEIVKRVLKSRHVKETTILLNLQGKSQFKRVAKATYALAE